MHLERPRRALDLIQGRLALHWGAQILAAVGNTVAEPESDFSHTALQLRDARISTTAKGIEVSLDGAGVLQIRRASDARSLPLAGLTLEQALAELAQGLRLFGVDVDALERPSHDLPSHPVEAGEPFAAFPTEATEVLHWMQGAHDLLGAVGRGDFGPTRLWPHHFDVARLWTLEGEGEQAKTVGIGMSPGDDSYAEPYFYVTPWPRPSSDRTLGPLPQGHWHGEGWTGAVLKGSTILEAKDRKQCVNEFLDAAIAASKSLVA